MTEFDPIKAAKEELTGLSGVLQAMQQRERACEEAMGRAESELNAVRKLRGYAQIQMMGLREKISKLEREKEGK